MKISQLETFMTIVQTGSFQAAAEKLHYSQTSVSVQMQKLETELGVRLLTRGRVTELTYAGKALYDKGLHLMAVYQDTLDTVESCVNGVSGTVSIGAMGLSTNRHIVSVVTRMMRAYPNISLELTNGNDKMLRKQLSQGMFDMILTIRQPIEPTHYTACELDEQKIVLLLPADHRLACKSVICCADLSGERLCMPRKHTDLYYAYTQILQNNGCIDFVAVHIDELSNFHPYVASGYCLGFVPENCLVNDECLVKREICDFSYKVVTTLIADDGAKLLSPVAQTVYNYIRDEFMND